MSTYSEKELDDLNIVENLKNDESGLHKEKSKIILALLFFLAIIAYLVYSTFVSKEEEKVVKKEKLTHIEKKQFKPPFVPKPKPVVRDELPISPFSRPEKKKVPLKVTKYTRGSAIMFNPSYQVQTDTNQIDSDTEESQTRSIYNKSTTLNEKEVSIFKGGDYAIAGKNRHNPNLSIAKGMYIECTMLTRIVSSYSGNTKCVLGEDIYSVNGNTLLLEKGSIATGHFEGQSVSNGVDRLYVIWDEIRTPNDVVVDLKSQATGKLGATGVSGDIDNHWGMRFGAAILVSIIDIGMDTAAQRINKSSNGGVTYNVGGSEVQNMSVVALEQFINIKPTFYKNHGDVVGIYVEKDLDFSKVYRLK